MIKKGILTSLLLVGMFFGASNLIFPPTLGVLSGNNMWLTIFGFLISGVGMTVFALIIGTLNSKGYVEDITLKFSSKFTHVYLFILYMVIGPLFAIPRTETVTYSIAIEPLNLINPILFSALYFLLAYCVSINFSKILDNLGKILTPIFIILILTLITAGFFKYKNNIPMTVSENFIGLNGFSSGLIEGYNTLDALTSVVFCIIAISTFKTFKFKDKQEFLGSICVFAIVTTLFFSVLYIGLAYLGNKFPIPLDVLNDPNINKGAYIITHSSKDLFGVFGQIFLGFMVTLTCLTTTVGLIISVSKYFSDTYKLSYKHLVVLFSFLGFIISNVGLNNIIKFSIPILLILYPITIVVVLFTTLNKFFKLSIKGMRITMTFVSLTSIFSVLGSTLNIDFINSLFSLIPFNDISCAWIIPFCIGLIFSFVLNDKIEGYKFDFDKFFS